MLGVGRHYRKVKAEIADTSTLDLGGLSEPLVVMPLDRWDKISQKALRFALNVSHDVHALHIDVGEETSELREQWRKFVETPAAKAGVPVCPLVVLRSPYRFVIHPILDYVLALERDHPDREIAVIIPEMVESHWYHYLMHNQRAELLKTLLLLKSRERVVIINVPWHLKA
jgi:hypothetical protein